MQVVLITIILTDGVAVLKPKFIPHASYQDELLARLQIHYSGG